MGMLPSSYLGCLSITYSYNDFYTKSMKMSLKKNVIKFHYNYFKMSKHKNLNDTKQIKIKTQIQFFALLD